VEP
jgi:uncharacterized protein (TIGR03084 family)